MGKINKTVASILKSRLHELRENEHACEQNGDEEGRKHWKALVIENLYSQALLEKHGLLK